MLSEVGQRLLLQQSVLSRKAKEKLIVEHPLLLLLRSHLLGGGSPAGGYRQRRVKADLAQTSPVGRGGIQDDIS